MNSKEDLYRANAIRVLSKIIDSTMLGAIERSAMKQSFSSSSYHHIYCDDKYLDTTTQQYSFYNLS